MTAGAWRHLAAGPPGIQDATSLTIDPNDGTIYMTTTDGLWRSTDATATWVPLRRDLLSNSNYAELWVDPASSHVFAVGPAGFSVSADRGRTFVNKRQSPAFIVRSARALPRTVIVGFGDGVWRTPDEGEIWTKATGYPSSRPQALSFDPKNAQIVYAGQQGQLYASSDAGASFASVGPKYPLPIIAVQPDTATAGRVVIGVDYDGVQASTTSGAAFTPIGTQPTKRVNSLAVDPTDPKRIYAGTYNGFLRTENGGTDWFLTTPGGSTTTYGTTLDPRAPSTVFTLGAASLLKSSDFGVSFAPATTSGSFVSVRSLVAAGTNVYASVIAGGVWKSADGGKSWASASMGLPSATTYMLAIDPANSSRILVTTDSGLYVTVNSAGTWTKATTDLDGKSVALIAIGSGGVIYGASSSSFHKSTTDGATWTTIYPTYSPQITGLATSPADPNTVYLSTTGALRKSTTGGGTGTWSSAVSGGAFLNVAIDPADANHVYASGASQVYWTTNGFTAGPGTGQASTLATGSALAIDPSNPMIVYVARDGARAWKSKDGGATFAPIRSGLYDDIYAFAVPRGGNGVVYAGTLHSGIFKTTSGGE